MFKKFSIILMLVVCCYCEENNEIMAEETRAKKKKKGIRMLVFIALFILSKLAVFKLASFFFIFAFFQKLFSIGGVLLTYFMKAQFGMPAPPTVAPSVAPVAPSVAPHNVYGPPDYNTIGYSYGPPDEALHDIPSLTDFSGPLSWLTHKP